MVSPLHTWKHKEPKGLWAGLGGLAVVAHVGALGLFLPYLGSTMQSGGSSDRTSVVPIELIDTEPTAKQSTASTADSTTPQTTGPETTQPANNTPTDQQSTTPPATPTNEATVEASPPVVTEENPVETRRNSSTPSEETESKPDEEETISDEQPGPVEPTEQNSSGTTDPQQNSEIPSEENREPSEQESPPEVEDKEDTLPTIGGEELPQPGTGSTANGTDQVAALSILTHAYVPDELRQDRFAITLPEPRGRRALSVRPQDVGCPKVEGIEQAQLTYRVGIDAAGTILSAGPWTGSNAGVSLSESEAAVVCMLKQSGFEFVPATDEGGSAIANSDLLLTFTLDLQTD
ncbi:MAG: hypothetical protein AAF810_00565 [Cyanobacteria bacterium P01_D01_bin.36]